ncbi:predicted protein [Lodderomyces elongisporus NRRL YB-4239]|uniref:Uncharacterized protein n=1 Tax=Lodderomyces elongisporus (strain ATCC 11503 / CBS 2605 / JCM 1781 / NBRC 1676 / NRRL YB-4239) TaxID=379508 RepID=A5E7N1_LODEL|nr:predicted protein [Lodderomyces elongisporus NRRL YB-4239]
MTQMSYRDYFPPLHHTIWNQTTRALAQSLVHWTILQQVHPSHLVMKMASFLSLMNLSRWMTKWRGSTCSRDAKPMMMRKTELQLQDQDRTATSLTIKATSVEELTTRMKKKMMMMLMRKNLIWTSTLTKRTSIHHCLVPRRHTLLITKTTRL